MLLISHLSCKLFINLKWLLWGASVTIILPNFSVELTLIMEYLQMLHRRKEWQNTLRTLYQRHLVWFDQTNWYVLCKVNHQTNQGKILPQYIACLIIVINTYWRDQCWERWLTPLKFLNFRLNWFWSCSKNLWTECSTQIVRDPLVLTTTTTATIKVIYNIMISFYS